ncbi:putative endopeptidase [Novosphingobium mathurense]|uniref:Putative endopeptidase n=2 Tax=Novosphingobium mathurense TaxID=428990 RepID=A0A1U6HTV6_9SPHN|nr:putative endopeptidase [Novosphingobium mathurense]
MYFPAPCKNRHPVRSRSVGAAATLSIAVTLSGWGHALASQPPTQIGPDDLAFSVSNMDTSIDPRKDFYLFAAGGWLKRVPRPEDRASYSFPVIQGKRIKDQLKAIIAAAERDAPTAPKGTSAQLVGDFYKAFMDVDRRREEGMKPLQEEFAKVDAISSIADLARYSAYAAKTDGIALLISYGPSPDLADSSRYAIYGGPGSTALKDERDVYRSDESAPRRIAYRKYVHEMLSTAGYAPTEADRVTKLVLDIETELDKAQLSPADKRDFNKLNNRMALAQAQALLPQIDVKTYFSELGIPEPKDVIVTEPTYFTAVSNMLKQRPLQDFKDYAKFRLIKQFSDFLSPDFDEPKRALNQAFTGVATLRPLDERGIAQVQGGLGQPLSQLYVHAYYDEDTRRKTSELITYIMAAMEKRIPTRDWLSDKTKVAALEKLKAFNNKVGYPDEWIDYSSVKIVPDNPVANAKAIISFGLKRELAKLGGPVKSDDFNGESTLPIAMNAAYQIFENGFQITAAISQAPAFEPNADPAVRFCRFGALIGHETTHGFDSTGRQFDAKGNLRNWWTLEDTKAFVTEAQKLVDQTAHTELAPGHANDGKLWVGENMADVGGIKLGYTALMDYLKDHPQENVKIDGYTQQQRCFIAWAQLWAENATEAYLINVAKSADHPPNIYRTVAPLQHFDAFYEAFGIKEGDPMWLPPEKRVNTW